jgi:hypothetical protein
MTWIPERKRAHQLPAVRLSSSSHLDASLRAAPSYSALRRSTPELVIGVAFLTLFSQLPLLPVQNWWQLPEAGHGLLLALWLHGSLRTPASAALHAPIPGLESRFSSRQYSFVTSRRLAPTRECVILALAALTVQPMGNIIISDGSYSLPRRTVGLRSFGTTIARRLIGEVDRVLPQSGPA